MNHDEKGNKKSPNNSVPCELEQNVSKSNKQMRESKFVSVGKYKSTTGPDDLRESFANTRNECFREKRLVLLGSR